MILPTNVKIRGANCSRKTQLQVSSFLCFHGLSQRAPRYRQKWHYFCCCWFPQFWPTLTQLNQWTLGVHEAMVLCDKGSLNRAHSCTWFHSVQPPRQAVAIGTSKTNYRSNSSSPCSVPPRHPCWSVPLSGTEKSWGPGGRPPQKPAAEAGPFSACWPSAAWLSHGRTVPSSSQGAGRIPCCPSDLCNTTPTGFRYCTLLHAQRGTPAHVPYYYYAPACVTTEISAGLVSILKIIIVERKNELHSWVPLFPGASVNLQTGPCSYCNNNSGVLERLFSNKPSAYTLHTQAKNNIISV